MRYLASQIFVDTEKNNCLKQDTLKYNHVVQNTNDELYICLLHNPTV